MPNPIGVNVSAIDTHDALAQIVRAESLGIPTAWMNTAVVRYDNITTLAVAATKTSRIFLGTSIVPTFPRHPLVAVQQARVVAELAPGRFRLGMGPSHRALVEPLGIEFSDPLGHLREYLRIIKPLLQQGKVDFVGKYYRAKESLPAPLKMQVLASALRQGSFELCGEEADGAITWLCPIPYLKKVAIPAIRAGAARAGRPVPPIIAHVPVCVHDNPDEVRAALRAQSMNVRLPFYQRMFEAAGFPEALEGKFSDRMIDSIVLSGNEDKVAEGLRAVFAEGIDEVMTSPFVAGNDRARSIDRAMLATAKAVNG